MDLSECGQDYRVKTNNSIRILRMSLTYSSLFLCWRGWKLRMTILFKQQGKHLLYEVWCRSFKPKNPLQVFILIFGRCWKYRMEHCSKFELKQTPSSTLKNSSPFRAMKGHANFLTRIEPKEHALKFAHYWKVVASQQSISVSNVIDIFMWSPLE